VIFFVPARKGSQRVNGKNTRFVCGRPLVDWTFERVRAVAGADDRVMVSSDDDVVLELGKRRGFDTFRRPADFCGNDAKMSDVLSFHFKYSPPGGTVCVLYPTSLLRSAAIIRGALVEWRERGGDDAVLMSVSPVYHRPYGLMRVEKEDGTGRDVLRLNSARGGSYYQSQNMPVDYRANGAVYVVPTNLIRLGQIDAQLFGPKTIPFIMTEEDGVEVDTDQDLAVSEFLLGRRLQDGSEPEGRTA